MREEVRTDNGIWDRARVDTHLGDEAADLAEVLADPKVKPYAIWRKLRERGVMVSARPVYEWAEKARRESR